MPKVSPGLTDVIAFDTEIAEPDRNGGSLRYRGIDIESLAGRGSHGDVWGLLVDGNFEIGLAPAEPLPIPRHSGKIPGDIQAAVAMMAPYLGLRHLFVIRDA